MAFPSTFLDIQNAVINKLRLDATNDLSKVKDWINQVYYEACIETNFYETSSSATTLTAGQTSVSVPSSIVKIEYIVPAGSDGSLWGPMEEVTFEEILENRAWAGSTQTTGAPSRYAFRSSQSSSIEVWPQAYGGETLTFYGVCLPNALSGNTDTPIFPEPYATMVLQYGALVQAAEYKKDPLVSEFNALYIQWIIKLRSLNNVRAGSKVQQFRVERQRPWPRGNSIDQGV